MYTILLGVLEHYYIHFNSPSNISKSIFYYINSIVHFYYDNKYIVSNIYFIKISSLSLFMIKIVIFQTLKAYSFSS